MDLTFQVPMQYCSLQHRTLLLSPVTSTHMKTQQPPNSFCQSFPSSQSSGAPSFSHDLCIPPTTYSLTIIMGTWEEGKMREKLPCTLTPQPVNATDPSRLSTLHTFQLYCSFIYSLRCQMLPGHLPGLSKGRGTGRRSNIQGWLPQILIVYKSEDSWIAE